MIKPVNERKINLDIPISDYVTSCTHTQTQTQTHTHTHTQSYTHKEKSSIIQSYSTFFPLCIIVFGLTLHL